MFAIQYTKMKKIKLAFLLLLITTMSVAVFTINKEIADEETISKTQYQAESYSGFDMFSKFNLY